MGRRRVPSARGGRRPLPMDTPSREPRSVGATVRSKIDATTYALELDTSLGLPETGYYSGAGELAVGQRVVAEWQPQLHFWQIQGLGQELETADSATAVGTIAAPATTGIHDEEVGWRPGLVILTATRRTSVGLDSGNPATSYSYGFANGSEHLVVSGAKAAGVSVDMHGAWRTDRAVSLTDEDGVALCTATLVLTATGFQLTFDNVDGNAYLIHYMAIPGVTAHIGTFARQTGSGVQDVAVSGMSGQIDALFTIGAFPNAAAPASSESDLASLIGIAVKNPVGTLQQRGTSWKKAGEGTFAGFHTANGHQVGMALAQYTGGLGGSLDTSRSGTVTALGTGLFTVDWATSAAEHQFGYVAVAGGDWFIWSGVEPGSTGTQSLSGAGFTPAGFLALSITTSGGRNQDADPTIAFADAERVRSHSFMYRHDNVGNLPDDHASAASNANLIAAYNVPDPPSIATSAEIDSRDADGITLNWTVSSAMLTLYTVVAVGGVIPATIPTVSEPVSHDDLSGVSADDHHAEDHASRHESGAADELDGGALAFTPTTSGDWDGPPTTVQAALDELASRVRALEP